MHQVLERHDKLINEAKHDKTAFPTHLATLPQNQQHPPTCIPPSSRIARIRMRRQQWLSSHSYISTILGSLSQGAMKKKGCFCNDGFQDSRFGGNSYNIFICILYSYVSYVLLNVVYINMVILFFHWLSSSNVRCMEHITKHFAKLDISILLMHFRVILLNPKQWP